MYTWLISIFISITNYKQEIQLNIYCFCFSKCSKRYTIHLVNESIDCAHSQNSTVHNHEHWILYLSLRIAKSIDCTHLHGTNKGK